MNTIQARELRIGNLVKFTEDKELYAGYHNKVNVVDFDTLKDIEFNNSKWYDPIQLNEDWLVRFGFKKIDKYTFVLNGFFIHNRKIGFVFNVGRKKIIQKFVHTIQNTYFCIEQKELKCLDTAQQNT